MPWRTCRGGGSEYGERMAPGRHARPTSSSVLDDFIAAAEFLIDREVHVAARSWRSPAARTAACWSGACDDAAARPVRGSIAGSLGVMDMLRYHLFTMRLGLGRRSTAASDDAAQFGYALQAYSPLHNIREGVCYPADARHDGRPRRSCGAGAFVQIRCDAPICAGVR